MKTEILSDLLGVLTIVNYIVGFIFVFLALILKWIWKTIEGVKNSKNTPDKFNGTYWVNHNLIPKLLSFVAVMISVFILLRFIGDIVNIGFSYFFCLVVGLTIDYWIDRLKKISPTYFIKK